MWAYRLFSTAMSQIGKPISRLDDLARYLNFDVGAPRRARHPQPRPDRDIDVARADQQRPVYAGEPIAIEDDDIVFDAAPRLTTRLDFAPDELGYLVNSDGLVLMGRSDDDQDEAQSLRLVPIRLEDGPVMPARATTTIRYKANLPKTPATRDAEAVPAPGEDTDALAQRALAGGEIRIFDARGRAITLRLRWVKLGKTADTGEDSWRLLFRVVGSALAMRAVGRGWQAVDRDFTFDDRGRLTNGAPVNLDLGRGLDPVTLELGHSGLTQFADTSGLVKVLACSQNGWPQSELREVAVREDGRVLGCFDNGRVGLLGLAAFARAQRYGDFRRAA